MKLVVNSNSPVKKLINEFEIKIKCNFIRFLSHTMTMFYYDSDKLKK